MTTGGGIDCLPQVKKDQSITNQTITWLFRFGQLQQNYTLLFIKFSLMKDIGIQWPTDGTLLRHSAAIYKKRVFMKQSIDSQFQADAKHVSGLIHDFVNGISTVDSSAMTLIIGSVSKLFQAVNI